MISLFWRLRSIQHGRYDKMNDNHPVILSYLFYIFILYLYLFVFVFILLYLFINLLNCQKFLYDK